MDMGVKAYAITPSAKPFSAVLPCRRVRSTKPICALLKEETDLPCSRAAKAASLLAAAVISFGAQPSLAAFRLPPLDPDPARCDRAYTGNTIGQANAVSDKLLDLRQCNFSGKNLSTKVLAGALLAGADLSGSTLKETILTKAYAVGATFEGANLTNAVVDRVDFSKANLKNAKFHNAVITGASFKEADLTGASFDEALIGGEDAKKLCLNSTLIGESRVEVGCRN